MPLLRDGIVAAETLVDVRDAVPRGISGRTIGAGTTLAELEASTRTSRRRCARPAGSRRRRSSGTWARSAATCCRRRAAGTGGSSSPAGCTAATAATHSEGQHREHAIFGNDFCASAHPSDPAAALLAIGARSAPTGASSTLAELYRLPTEDDRSTTTLAPDELILELELPEVEASAYLKAMDRQRWAFALVGVAAARVGGETRIALAGAAPIPWLLSAPDELERATPLEGTAFKVEIARTLVARATAGALGTIRDRHAAPPRPPLLLLLLALSLAACGGSDEPEASGTAGATTEAPSSSERRLRRPSTRPAPKPDGGETAPTEPLDAGTTYELVVETNCGDFTIKLDPTRRRRRPRRSSRSPSAASTTTRPSTASCPAS